MWVDSFFLKCGLGVDPEVKPQGYTYLKTSLKRKSLCVAFNMPLDAYLEIPSCESCSLYHDIPGPKKNEVQREGKTESWVCSYGTSTFFATSKALIKAVH